MKKYKLVSLVPKDGQEISVGDYNILIRGGIGNAIVVQMPNEMLRYMDDYKPIKEAVSRATGLDNEVMLITDDVEFCRFVEVDDE